MDNFIERFRSICSNNYLSLDNLNVTSVGDNVKKDEIMVRLARVKEIIKNFNPDFVRSIVMGVINDLYYKNKDMIINSGIANIEFLLYTKYTEEVYQNAIIKAFLGIEGMCGVYNPLSSEGKIYSYSEYAANSSSRSKPFLSSTIVLEDVATINFSILNKLSTAPDNHKVHVDEKVKSFLNVDLTKEGIDRQISRDYLAGELVYSELV